MCGQQGETRLLPRKQCSAFFLSDGLAQRVTAYRGNPKQPGPFCRLEPRVLQSCWPPSSGCPVAGCWPPLTAAAAGPPPQPPPPGLSPPGGGSQRWGAARLMSLPRAPRQVSGGEAHGRGGRGCGRRWRQQRLRCFFNSSLQLPAVHMGWVILTTISWPRRSRDQAAPGGGRGRHDDQPLTGRPHAAVCAAACTVARGTQNPPRLHALQSVLPDIGGYGEDPVAAVVSASDTAESARQETAAGKQVGGGVVPTGGRGRGTAGLLHYSTDPAGSLTKIHSPACLMYAAAPTVPASNALCLQRTTAPALLHLQGALGAAADAASGAVSSAAEAARGAVGEAASAAKGAVGEAAESGGVASPAALVSCMLCACCALPAAAPAWHQTLTPLPALLSATCLPCCAMRCSAARWGGCHGGGECEGARGGARDQRARQGGLDPLEVSGQAEGMRRLRGVHMSPVGCMLLAGSRLAAGQWQQAGELAA